LGMSNYARDGATTQEHQNMSVIVGRFTVSGGPKNFEIHHDILSAGGGTQGLGVSTDDGEDEVYTDVEIREIIDDFDLMHIREEATANVGGGSSSVGFNNRVLTHTPTNEIPGASLSTNIITLPPGTFRILVLSPNYRGTRIRNVFYDRDAAVAVVLGQNNFARQSLTHADLTYSIGQFKIDEETDFDVRMDVGEAFATIGLGVDVDDGNSEVYTSILIWQIS
ncbi:hypothetical protein LCGC14_2910860, partial [marine sediment metagenome]